MARRDELLEQVHGARKGHHRRHRSGKKGKNFIAGAIQHPGALHEDLGVPQGKKIPRAELQAASHQPGKLGERARFALTLSRLGK